MQQHVVAIPYPAQGHITPMLQLCRQLAPHGFTFTFVNTHHIHQRVQRARLAHPDEEHRTSNNGELTDHALAHNSSQNVQGQRDLCGEHSSIRMVFVAGGRAPEEHAQQSTWADVFQAAEDMQEPVEQCLSRILRERAVTFLLSDVIFSWSGSTASKFSLPSVAFWPSSAAAFSTFLYFSDLAAEGKNLPFAGNEVDEAGVATKLEGIPGLPPTRLCDVPKVWDTNTWKVEHPLLRSFQEVVQKASCLILNTFEELEGQVLEALRKRLPSVAVGPLIPSQFMQLHSAVRFLPGRVVTGPEAPLSLFPEDRTCLTWLDTQAPSSVLFVSFGSISLRTERQLRELAHGVEASGCPFLWVRRPGLDDMGRDKRGERDNRYEDDENSSKRSTDTRHNPSGGLVVSWAPQLQVLSHQAVGGFITHCGWNSVMESVAMGVPMLCWADTGERMLNQRIVVEFWKCGIHMVAGTKRAKQHIDEAVLVGREEVENSVRQLMYDEAGAPIRARAAQLRAISKEAYVDAENSFRELLKGTELKCPGR